MRSLAVDPQLGPLSCAIITIVMLTKMNAFRACIASIFRTYYSFRIAQDPDTTFNIMVMSTGAITELGIGVVVSCLPVLPRLFQDLRSKLPKLSARHASPSTLSSGRYLASSTSRQNHWVSRGSTNPKHKSWRAENTYAYQEGPDASEYAKLDIHDPIPLEEGLSSRPLPPTPIFQVAERYAALHSDTPALTQT